MPQRRNSIDFILNVTITVFVVVIPLGLGAIAYVEWFIPNTVNEYVAATYGDFQQISIQLKSIAPTFDTAKNTTFVTGITENSNTIDQKVKKIQRLIDAVSIPKNNNLFGDPPTAKLAAQTEEFYQKADQFLATASETGDLLTQIIAGLNASTSIHTDTLLASENMSELSTSLSDLKKGYQQQTSLEPNLPQTKSKEFTSLIESSQQLTDHYLEDIGIVIDKLDALSKAMTSKNPVKIEFAIIQLDELSKQDRDQEILSLKSKILDLIDQIEQQVQDDYDQLIIAQQEVESSYNYINETLGSTEQKY